MKGAILSLLALPLMAAWAAAPATVPDDAALTPRALEELERARRTRARDPQYLPEIEPFEIEPNRIYYTRVNFWHEYGRYQTTNPRPGPTWRGSWTTSAATRASSRTEQSRNLLVGESGMTSSDATRANSATHPRYVPPSGERVPELTGNLVHDAQTAALMFEHGVRTIYTRDTDFHRFPGIDVRDPLRDD